MRERDSSLPSCFAVNSPITAEWTESWRPSTAIFPPSTFTSVTPLESTLKFFYDWATNFVKETAYFREGRKNMILVLDGYGCHVQYKVLQYLKENGVYVIGLPAHTSHILQPLDVTVFGPFKSYIQKQVHSRAMRTHALDAFDVGDVLKFALSDAVTASNVVSGFKKCGIWDPQSRGHVSRSSRVCTILRKTLP